jgi:hypothetical protein
MLSATTSQCQVDDDRLRIQTEMVQVLVDESDFDFVQVLPVNQLSEYSRQHAKMLHAISEPPESAVIFL